MIINSVNNNKIKELSKLNNTKYRKDADIFLVEGFHLVEEAYKNNLLKEVYSIDDIDYFDVPITVVSEPVMKKLTNMASIPTMIGVVYKKKDTLKGNKVLILDGIQDPGNLGTIIRSGVAFDVDTIVLSKDTVDLYNSKVVRATEGMLFNINIIEEELIDFIPRLKSMGYKIYSTNVDNIHLLLIRASIPTCIDALDARILLNCSIAHERELEGPNKSLPVAKLMMKYAIDVSSI